MAEKPPDARSIGFVGLGDLGAEIARRIHASGWPLTVYARRAEVQHEFAKLGVTVASDLRALGRASEILGICVVDDHQVEDVLFDSGLAAEMPKDGLVLIHSTIQPQSCRAIAERAARYGLSVLDVPVSASGGYMPADRALTFMVGGDAESFARARPLLESVATTVRHVGPLGSGQLTKIINNFLYHAQKALANDAVAIARAHALDVPAAADVWLHSSGASRALDQYRMATFKGVIPRVDGDARQTIPVVRKDNQLAATVADAAGVDAAQALAMGRRIVELLEAQLAAGS